MMASSGQTPSLFWWLIESVNRGSPCLLLFYWEIKQILLHPAYRIIFWTCQLVENLRSSFGTWCIMFYKHVWLVNICSLISGNLMYYFSTKPKSANVSIMPKQDESLAICKKTFLIISKLTFISMNYASISFMACFFYISLAEKTFEYSQQLAWLVIRCDR